MSVVDSIFSLTLSEYNPAKNMEFVKKLLQKLLIQKTSYKKSDIQIITCKKTLIQII